MSLAFHRYPKVSDPNVPLINRDAAIHNLAAARSKCLRAVSQAEKGECSAEAINGIRFALLHLDDTLDEMRA